MKRLSGALGKGKENKKKASTLTDNVEVEKTTSRKIFISDYELLRKYAFFTNQTVTKAIDNIFEQVDDEIRNKGLDILPNISKDELENEEEQKNIRISSQTNFALKELSRTSKIPIKYLLSIILMHKKEDIINEIRNNTVI